MNYYAGIGSRETPPAICQLMIKIAHDLEDQGYILRSGGAEGADKAFESGVKYQARKEIYLPWRGFNGNQSILYLADDIFKKVEGNSLLKKTVEIAKYYHPAWDKLSNGAKRMMIRNIFQVLGGKLDSPVDFIVCWTKDGSATGGTGQALRYAMDHGIKIYNLYIDWEVLELNERIINNWVETGIRD